MKFGQEIREEGPASHHEKRGTPTMGGVLIIGSVFISTVLWARLDSLYLMDRAWGHDSVCGGRICRRLYKDRQETKSRADRADKSSRDS